MTSSREPPQTSRLFPAMRIASAPVSMLKKYRIGVHGFEIMDLRTGAELPKNDGKGSAYEKDENQAPGGSNHDAEKNSPETPPLPVCLFDPSIKAVRKELAKEWSLTVLILFCFIICVLSLYWAVLFHVPRNLSTLTVAVVSFDGRIPPFEGTTPLVGQFVEQLAREQAVLPAYTLGYRVESPDKYSGNPLAVRQAVYDEHAWAAINTTYSDYIGPQLFEFQINVVSTFGEQWIWNVLSNTSLDAATYSRAPQALNPAIAFSSFDLRLFVPAQATPAVTIGLIYLVIIAFFSFSLFLPVYTKFLVPKGHPPLHFWELVLLRSLMTTATYFLISLAYSLVSLAFLIPFSNDYPHEGATLAKDPDAYGHATLVVYWMLNWVEIWLVFWVISNVSTAFYAIPLAPGFFQFGYAWPLYHIVNASRTLIIDTHSRIGLNFGALFAWCAVDTTLFPFCRVFMRRKTNKEWMRKVPRSKIQYLIDG
ncbi:uncharacterized protein A1O5_00824 [Cladophialophora psammophila CBS 110553]|uniref:DUF3533 domain-containing protein n=1 Tax=Cladophialophora psammophila CBS 110553 TaxID=1182543 RepID=W9XH91_9EURO|nr:uncharacterized protein A1O5_00824 [Cladophialophora psammophila CBS 110553]EXJ76316.1 hypothetical protein A1O5_00824 [Cladophialophora psammophila CBS 110553]